MKNIDIRYPAGIGVSDIDVYKTNKKKAYITTPTYFLKLRRKETYSGEFGFDWIDLDSINGNVQKIQGVDFTALEYFYMKPSAPNNPRDLGNFVTAPDHIAEAQKIIKDSYTTTKCGNHHIDIPWILVKPGKTVEISMEISLTTNAAISSEAIRITGDEFYDFEIEDATKTNATLEKKITDSKTITLKIKCLKEAPEMQYKILQESADSNPFTVGAFTMMENKIQKLKFRVIALVSKDDSSSANAKALFEKFIKKNIPDFLNNKSLNQAGYEVEIENQDVLNNLETANLDNYYYAFDKADWTSKKYFGKKGTEEVLVEDQEDLGGPVKANMLDDITYSEYLKKLKSKKLAYNGGVIILADYRSSGNIAAFSRTSPLNHYKLFVYSTSIEKPGNYAHEIGHMLGLQHSFFMENDRKDYQEQRVTILGNNLPANNPKYDPGILNRIKEVDTAAYTIYSNRNMVADKKTIGTAIDNLIKDQEKNYEEVKKNRDLVIQKFKNYPDSYLVNGQQTKAQYIAASNELMKQSQDFINDNKKAKIELNQSSIPGYFTLKVWAHFLRKDYQVLLRQSYTYLKRVIDQIHDNNLMFTQEKTFNIMDYSTEKLCFMQHQIKIMREDLLNYLDPDKQKAASTTPVKKK